MRWVNEEPKRVEWGDYRVVTKFLFFPVTIKGETRWLETATIIQFYSPKTPIGEIPRYWCDEAFVNDGNILDAIEGLLAEHRACLSRGRYLSDDEIEADVKMYRAKLQKQCGVV
jgi:hypothetical protein